MDSHHQDERHDLDDQDKDRDDHPNAFKRPIWQKHHWRLELVQRLLKAEFKIEARLSDILLLEGFSRANRYSTLNYKISCKKRFVAGPSSYRTTQPGCVEIPAGTKQFLLQLRNPDVETFLREPCIASVENEVAMMSLIRDALQEERSTRSIPFVVPKVYGYRIAGDPEFSLDGKPASSGWILKEFRPENNKNHQFHELDKKQQEAALGDMATVLKKLQDFKLPTGVTRFGGVRFKKGDPDHPIVSAEMDGTETGSWESYQAYYISRFKAAMRMADDNSFCNGWKERGVRQHLDRFIDKDFPELFKAMGPDVTNASGGGSSAHNSAPDSSTCGKETKVIVLGNFTYQNMLFDHLTGNIVTLLSYESACILHPSYEFIRSFNSQYWPFPLWPSQESGNQAASTRNNMRGFPTSSPPKAVLPQEEDVTHEQKPLIKQIKQIHLTEQKHLNLWWEKLERRDLMGPSVITGIQAVAGVDAVLRCILPYNARQDSLMIIHEEDYQIVELIKKGIEKCEAEIKDNICGLPF